MATTTLTRGSGSRRRTTTGLGVLGTSALVVCVLLMVLAVVGPWITPHDPNSIALENAYVGTTAGHPLGFDQLGRDLLSRVLAGARTTLLGPLSIILLATVVGVGVAIGSAWIGGAFDRAASACLSVLFAIPGLLLAVLAVALFGAGLPAIVTALAIAYVPYIALVVRSAAMREVAQPYIAALTVQGVSGFMISARHILPNVAPLVLAQAAVAFGYAIVDMAALSFLGFGVQPPTANWGVMIAEGQPGIQQGYFLPALVAGIFIAISVGAFNMLGERLSRRGEAR